MFAVLCYAAVVEYNLLQTPACSSTGLPCTRRRTRVCECRVLRPLRDPNQALGLPGVKHPLKENLIQKVSRDFWKTRIILPKHFIVSLFSIEHSFQQYIFTNFIIYSFIIQKHNQEVVVDWLD